jgi:hypothetical protein
MAGLRQKFESLEFAVRDGKASPAVLDPLIAVVEAELNTLLPAILQAIADDEPAAAAVDWPAVRQLLATLATRLEGGYIDGNQLFNDNFPCCVRRWAVLRSPWKSRSTTLPTRKRWPPCAAHRKGLPNCRLDRQPSAAGRGRSTGKNG